LLSHNFILDFFELFSSALHGKLESNWSGAIARFRIHAYACSFFRAFRAIGDSAQFDEECVTWPDWCVEITGERR